MYLRSHRGTLLGLGSGVVVPQNEQERVAMTRERWQQVRIVLEGALQLKHEARRAYLDQACSSDQSLRLEVDSLLAADEQARTSFLQSPPLVMRLVRGTHLGDFEIQSLLGAGGMGEVYRARDLRLQRDVAIKILPAVVSSDPDRLRRFEQEATAAAALNHPNILAVFQMGTYEGAPYMVSELLQGETLRGQIKRGRLPIRRAIEYAVQIARGLAAAHEKGIVHRDLKPENLFVTQDGRVKILDFGLAKLTQPQPGSEHSEPTRSEGTEPGVVMGTVGYMAPEQVRGQTADHRADIFAFGAILYEMLAGQRAFHKPTSAETMAAILNEDPPVISQVVRDLPPALERVVHRCLEKNPGQRFQSASDLAFALDALSDSTVSRTRALETVPPAWGKLAATVVGIVATAMAVLGLGWLIYRSRSNPSVAPASEWTQLTTFVDSATSPALSPDGRMLAFIRGPDPFVTKGDIYIKLLPEGKPVQLTHDDTQKMGPAFSPDGSQIAYTVSSGNWDTWIVPAFGGEPRLMLTNASGLTWIDAQQLLFSEIKQGRHMGIVTSLENRNAERDVYLPPGEASMAHRSYISPNHKWTLVVWMAPDARFRPCKLVPFEDSSAARSVGPPNAACTAAAWSPDGRWMYFSSSAGGSLHNWRQRFPDGIPEQITFGATEEEGIAVAPDGRSFVTSVGSAATSAWVHDHGRDHQITSEGAVHVSFGSPDDTSTRAVFSPDDRRLYYLVQPSPHSTSMELQVSEISSGRSETVLSGLGSASAFDLSPDGQTVAYSVSNQDNNESIWLAPLDHHSPPRRIRLSANSPLFAPDGSLFFMTFEGNQNFVYRMNQDGSGEQEVIADPIVQLQTVSPDGKWVVAQVALPGEIPRRAVVAIPTGNGERKRICVGLCAARWTLDGRFLFISFPGMSHTQLIGWGTVLVPLPPGKLFPQLPPSGLKSDRETAELPGATVIDNYIVPATHGSTYAFTLTTAHRNIYRIPLH
jgi:eukaryotic-like serine/threonine-protein kinase